MTYALEGQDRSLLSPIRQIRESYLCEKVTRSDAANRLKVSVSTLNRWLKEDEGIDLRGLNYITIGKRYNPCASKGTLFERHSFRLCFSV